ncbi:MAG: SRPBCC family protein [Candidatus Eremiobacteraeota bacterium]|nr:SRPBCC family protein [Candidatus Eremiobacteraeota bacterium]
MTRVYEVRVEAEIAAPPEALWARVADHEGTPSWVDAVKAVTIVREGQGRTGLGAVRVVAFKPRLWTTISEEITFFDPPHEFRYVLFKGMPGLHSHLGKIIVDDLGGDRSRLRWEVDFVFRSFHPFRPFVPSFGRSFEAVLADGVATLKRQLEGDRTTAASRGPA